MDVNVGDHVVIDPSGLTGVVKFVGETEFAGGEWVGVHLSTRDGKNNGVVRGVRYMDAVPEGHGLFVRPTACARVRAPARSPSSRGSSSPRKRKTSRAGLARSMSRRQVAGEDELVLAHEDLFDAALDYENMNFLEILVEEDGVSVVGIDAKGNTALHMVAEKGGGRKGIRVLQYLMDQGLRPHIHQKNKAGATAVMVAAREHNWKVMHYLICEGADVISKGHKDDLKSVWEECLNNHAGMKALHLGMEEQHQRRKAHRLPVPLMRHKGGSILKTLFRTAAAGDMKYVRMLLEQREFPADAADDIKGNNVLHKIANDPKRLSMIKYIVAMGGAFDAKNKVGDTPCLIAARSRNWVVMQYLVSIGSSVSTKDEKNGKSVFKYAQANLQSRKALADGLAEKKKNQHRGARRAPPSRAVPNYDVEEDGDDTETQQQADYGGYEDTDTGDVGAHDTTVEDTYDDRSEFSHRPDSPTSEEERQQQAILDKAAKPSNVGAGTFQGVCTGKKRDKSEGKKCQVIVTPYSILLQYKKGAWYSRKELVEEYRWSDNMSMEKVDDHTLRVVLDPMRAVELTISPCQPDALEEFIWKHIWQSVFEVSVNEAKELLAQYDLFCHDTITALSENAKAREKLNEQAEAAADGDDQALQDDIESELALVDRAIEDLVARFDNIRQQGETLSHTFEKMFEALDRRLSAEEVRKREYAANDDFLKAAEVKADMEQIAEQMQNVRKDIDRVKELSAKMAEAEAEHVGSDQAF